MIYSFDMEVAKEYGVNEAIMIANLQYWINKNKANSRNFFDGHYWTYNSKRAFTELFPCWSEQTIKTILTHLKDKQIIITGNYNQNAYDHTLWYAFVDEDKWLLNSVNQQHTSLSEKDPIEWLKSTNHTVEINRPIPDNKPNNKPNIPPYIPPEDKFEVLWQAYTPYVSPDGKSVNKGAKKPTKEKFNKIVAKGVNPDEIILGAKNYIADCFEHKCLTKNLVTFLNQEQWKEFLVAKEHPYEKDAEDFTEHWNKMVYKGITASDRFAQVIDTTTDEVKNLLHNVRQTVLEIMQDTKKRMDNGEKPILPVKPPYGNVWLFAFSMLLKRRFYSDFLYSGCTITPKFFCGHVKEIVDPYSLEYLNESEKRCHE